MISPTDPAARYTASANSVAGYAYSDNCLIDLEHAVIVDVEATTTIRQARIIWIEIVGAAQVGLGRHLPAGGLRQRDGVRSNCSAVRVIEWSTSPTKILA